MENRQKYKEQFTYKTYFSFGRFISYYYQIKLVMETDAQSCAVIGVGDGLVPFYYRKNKITVTTIDIDPDLDPDLKISVLDLLGKQDLSKKFDVTVCCQVLEHMPYDVFINALENLRYITKKRIVISLPDTSQCFAAAGFISKIGNKALCVQLPYRKKKHIENDDHYWEIGEKDSELKRIMSDMEAALGKISTFRNCFFPYHRFFIADEGN